MPWRAAGCESRNRAPCRLAHAALRSAALACAARAFRRSTPTKGRFCLRRSSVGTSVMERKTCVSQCGLRDTDITASTRTQRIETATPTRANRYTADKVLSNAGESGGMRRVDRRARSNSDARRAFLRRARSVVPKSGSSARTSHARSLADVRVHASRAPDFESLTDRVPRSRRATRASALRASPSRRRCDSAAGRFRP